MTADAHSTEQPLRFDKDHIWHPYSTTINPPPVFHVHSAKGVYLELKNGQKLVDGMASWWSVIHGYQNPQISNAIKKQLAILPHVMFGGLTHDPAIELAEKLLQITPPSLQYIFYADSGSVAVEVAIKMAIQYWHARDMPNKKRLMTVRGGYHGDTFGAMAVCDPVTGMHSIFSDCLTKQIFADRPEIAFDSPWSQRATTHLENLFAEHAAELAALIIEPIVQGAGGMRFYHEQYLIKIRQLCDTHNVLLICDEIATGFGRTGKLFAVEHANIEPDILCLGKALTGGYMTMAATLANEEVAQTISSGGPGVFMHGPTFMANPLACSSAIASLNLLETNQWHNQVTAIESHLNAALRPCARLAAVADVRVLGAIGVVELHQDVDMREIPNLFVERGAWVRPFGKLIYVMPPYIINESELSILTNAITEVLQILSSQ